jgi:hypothetical protein
MERWERTSAAWQRLVALIFCASIALLPVLALAQGTPPGQGGTGSGSSQPMETPGGHAPRGEGSGIAWIVAILAIAVIIWLFTRRRGGRVNR